MEAVEVAVVEEEASAEEAVVAVEEVGEADSLLEARTGVAGEAGVEAEGVSTGEHSPYLINSSPAIKLCACEDVRSFGRENERYGLSSYENMHVYTFEPPSYALFLADKKNVEKSPKLNENLGKLNINITRN